MANTASLMVEAHRPTGPAPAWDCAYVGETVLFVTGVVGFLLTLSTAGRPGLSAPAIVSGLMVLIGAGLFVARG